ncbi:MAG: NHL repeat-containing protein [Methanocella sp.]
MRSSCFEMVWLKINKNVRFWLLPVVALAAGLIIGVIIGYSLNITPLQGAISSTVHFYYPCSLGVGPDGSVYVVDSGELHVMARGGAWTTIAPAGSTLGQVYLQGGGVAVGRDGTVYVADTRHDRIQVMSPDGTWVGWGSRGTDLGRFNHPGGVAVDSDGTVYVADTDNHRVQMRAPDGTWAILGKWTISRSYGDGPGEFYSPYDVAVGRDGTLYVADYGDDQIQMRTPDGTWAILGSHGDGLGQFAAPSGLAVGPDGALYVADYDNDRIQVRASDGTWTSWGSRGTGFGQFRGPSDVAVSRGGTVYVADSGNDHVQARSPDGTWWVLG